MNAEREMHCWRWMAGALLRRERLSSSKPAAKRRRVRRHADWILELAVMLALALLLPPPRTRK
jgi:hypothetical protein